ncbi:Co2+/Mg2+ efflux protein ApaG [Labrys wisconsinensis]|uniref:Protein ApaG n=1 Tax=Labrys wisconsinensis TaxID=425677 RepID=A0ABU0JH76_9HYPH|nr:Co2+/Mg2+ efflux protein ApaG [Labrys wisconsinensis]MDQ0472768.1 ApaG protein [Labrys wisconsinensis]
MYRAVTRLIRVTVEPRYLPQESRPEEGHYFWAYTVEIVNMGPETVQLESRFWEITDEIGRRHEVRGAGVVGERPVLGPGERFEYTSGCPLPTPSGLMVGSYRMTSESGESFSVSIPAFSLDSPHVRRVVN